MQIKLKGISKRGKDRINEHGDTFEVIEKEANEDGQLHAILVESLNNTWRGEKWLGCLMYFTMAAVILIP